MGMVLHTLAARHESLVDEALREKSDLISLQSFLVRRWHSDGHPEVSPRFAAMELASTSVAD